MNPLLLAIVAPLLAASPPPSPPALCAPHTDSAAASRDAEADPLTVAALLLAGQQIQSALRDLSTGLGFQGASVVGQASTQIGLLMDDLDRLAQGRVQVPIENLGAEVQNLARQLDNSITHANWLVDRQRQCGFRQLEQLMAGLRTITLQASDRIPVGARNAPRFDYIQFDNAGPSVVPAAGGRATLNGYRLWPEARLAPVVELLDNARSARLATLRPASGGSADEVNVRVAPEVIRRHAGECLYLRVTPRAHRGIWPFRRVVTLDAFARPLCIPAAYTAQVQMEAEIRYTCPRTERRTLPAVRFYYENHENEERRFDETRAVAVPDGCRIVGAPYRQDSITRDILGASFDFTDRSITAHAHMDDCHTVVTNACTRHGVWSYTVTPEVECAVSDPHHETARSAWVPMGTAVTRMEVDLPRGCDFSQSDVKFRMWTQVPGGQPVLAMESPWLPAPSGGTQHVQQIAFGNMLARAAYNAGSASAASASIELDSPQCSY